MGAGGDKGGNQGWVEEIGSRGGDVPSERGRKGGTGGEGRASVGEKRRGWGERRSGGGENWKIRRRGLGGGGGRRN